VWTQRGENGTHGASGMTTKSASASMREGDQPVPVEAVNEEDDSQLVAS
jgi:hypothetical protein